jgi:hypothetical protein
MQPNEITIGVLSDGVRVVFSLVLGLIERRQNCRREQATDRGDQKVDGKGPRTQRRHPGSILVHSGGRSPRRKLICSGVSKDDPTVVTNVVETADVAEIV